MSLISLLNHEVLPVPRVTKISLRAFDMLSDRLVIFFLMWEFFINNLNISSVKIWNFIVCAFWIVRNRFVEVCWAALVYKKSCINIDTWLFKQTGSGCPVTRTTNECGKCIWRPWYPGALRRLLTYRKIYLVKIFS